MWPFWLSKVLFHIFLYFSYLHPSFSCHFSFLLWTFFGLLSLLLPYCPKGGAVLCRLFLGQEGIMRKEYGFPKDLQKFAGFVCMENTTIEVLFGRRQKVTHRHHESQGKHDYYHCKRHLEMGSFLTCIFFSILLLVDYHWVWLSLVVSSHFDSR